LQNKKVAYTAALLADYTL